MVQNECGMVNDEGQQLMTDQGQLEKRTKEFALFIHKIAIVEKEAGETQYWLEMFSDSGS